MATGLARTLLHLAQYLLPSHARREWKEEWLRELEHGRKAPFFRTASNILRDAHFARRHAEQLEPRRRPLRMEAAAFVIATLLWIIYALPVPKVPCGSHLQRTAFVQRTYAAMGISLSSATLRLREELERAIWVEDVAAFRVRFYGAPGAEVSRNLFEVLGVTPLAGATLRDAAMDQTVITYALWKDQFHGDPSVVGKAVTLNGRRYTVVGVLPEDFAFVSHRLRYFVPLSEGSRAAGTLVRLRPTVPFEIAERALRDLAARVEGNWRKDVYRLYPYLQSPRWQDTFYPALGIALAGFLGGALYLYRKLRGTPRSYAVLALRLLLSGTALAEAGAVAVRLLSENLVPVGILHLWFFTIACCLLVAFTLRDHLGRCPVCFEQLRMPMRVGTWSSVVMDAPAIETACPNGHGLLYRKETGDMRGRWTKLDDSWRDLFAGRSE